MIVSLCNIENSFDSFLIEGDSQINQKTEISLQNNYTIGYLDKDTQMLSSKIGCD